MADVFTKRKRSLVMAAIRAYGNKDTELKLAAIFRASQITGWRRHQSLPGRPDFVFRKQRLAIFVDGCFWHGCPQHGRKPTSNQNYWIPKLRRNRQRDLEAKRALTKAGWLVLRFWEHELGYPTKVVTKVQRHLSSLQSTHK
jgi:DNA mismatch endonuclease (patch repair protein)